MRIDAQNPALAALTQQTTTARPVPNGQEENFGQVLMDAIQEVNKIQGESAKLQEDLMANRPVEYHDLMIAMERSGTAMQLTMSVRNKVLEAYQEISRMQI